MTPRTVRDLPLPARTRWQPLRLGLVELYHYDYEEFWFRDGHLLLRGNNGTGKSKVLSLTLPFLLDARLEPSRVEPDGDRNKRMDWNLLMGHLPQRTGYTWLELGRIGDDGAPVYLTLGCGLKAVSGRRRVDRWFFVTGQRVGESLALISPEGAVASRERLAEAIGQHGQLHETAAEYRQAVDERVFRLGEAGYRALVDTLIELRQPQLSKQPDERRLSKALTDALPALAASVLDDVSTALTQLEDDRDALTGLERRRAAVARFGASYRDYASVQARREARGPRQTESRLDAARRALAAAREALEAATREAEEQAARCETIATDLAGARAELEECRADPVMRDARRLAEFERAAAAREHDAARAQTRRETALQRHAAESAERMRRETEFEAVTAHLAEAAEITAALAGEVGLAREHAEVSAPFATLLAQPDAALDEAAIVSSRHAFDSHTRRRREQIGRVRELTAERDTALAAYGRAHDLAGEGRSAHDRAGQRAREADAALKGCAADHCAAWSTWLEALEALSVPDAEDVLGALEDWVETLEGASPGRRAAEQATTRAAAAIAGKRAALDAREAPLRAEGAELAAETTRLEQGEDRVPTAPHGRAPRVREGRAGAPLWQLVDFRDTVGAPGRAGLEAALEASGLLDAWVTPEGIVLDPDTHDDWLVPGERAEHSLGNWLVPSPGVVPVAPARIGAVLDTIACTLDPDPAAPAWISPTGRYRVGPREGAWTKPVAEYVGFAARTEARERRLAAILARRNAIAQTLVSLSDERARLDAVDARAATEAAAAPGDDALRAAHAELSVAERERRATLDRLAALEARAQAANERVAAARRRLEEDGAALGLPTAREELAEIDAALGRYERATQDLRHAGRDAASAHAEHARQWTREAEAKATLEQETTDAAEARREAEAARRRHRVLSDTMGAEIAELERRLSASEAQVSVTERTLEQAQEQRQAAQLEAARHEERVNAEGERERERSAERAAAVERLRAFAGTDLLRVAVPSLEVPDPRDEWTAEGALRAARETERALAGVPAEDGDWERVRDRIGRDYAELGTALSALGERAEGEQTEFGLVVTIRYRGRALAPDIIEREFGDEIAQRRAVLTAREREVIENHLQAEVAVNLQRLLQEAIRRVQDVNAELHKRPTSTGVRFRLVWETIPDSEGGVSEGLTKARKSLLDRTADAWSPEDREAVGAFLQRRIAAEAEAGDGESLRAQLERALDYRAWHRFRVERYQDGTWRRLAGPASSGERALGLTVPLFAAASSHYASSDYAFAPRLVLLDEAFAGIDDAARAHCMALVREFDLDFVMTSEREWGCYAELPGVSICHLVRREGVDAVHVSRWSWDGRARRAEPEPARPFGETAPAPA